MWLVSFLEGLVSVPRKRGGSALCRVSGTLSAKHTLVPRVKGFLASVEGLRNHVDAVYVVTIAYHHPDPSLYQWFSLNMPKVHLHVDVHPIESLPTDEVELSAWAYQQYEVIDRNLIRFHETGRLGEGNFAEPISTSHWLRPESKRRTFEE